MTIGERIKEARKVRGLSRPQLAEAAGIKYPTLAGIENNDQAGTTQLPQIADALGVSVRWLQTGKGPRDAKPGIVDDDWSDILGYSQAMGLGGGPEAQEYAETHSLKFRADSLARKRLNPSKLAVMYGRGDSMEPRVLSGDAILFDMSDTKPRDGALFVIMVDGGGAAKEYQVKRCEILDDLVYFKADNPGGDHNWKKPRRMDSPRHPIEIIGRVRWIGSWEG
ncbi:XRE family transcriptional regulator [Stenotrophomonas acidaminiphila]|uniref:XRE family transcriptional regulator n=1 Tax=Stenotrophomonas acidaminiphila TaxID=128780 RepID=UPI003CFE11C2